SAFKALLKIAPTRFQQFWTRLGEETFVKKSEEELAAEYRSRRYSEKQKVQYYYYQSTSKLTTTQEYVPRKRSVSAPQRPVIPLGALVSPPINISGSVSPIPSNNTKKAAESPVSEDETNAHSDSNLEHSNEN